MVLVGDCVATHEGKNLVSISPMRFSMFPMAVFLTWTNLMYATSSVMHGSSRTDKFMKHPLLFSLMDDWPWLEMIRSRFTCSVTGMERIAVYRSYSMVRLARDAVFWVSTTVPLF